MKLKIAIYTFGKIKSIYADEETNQFTIGDVEINKGVSSFIRTALSLIKNWPEKLVAEEGKGRDCHYKIAFEEGGTSKLIEADGKFPEDFYKLSNLIFSYEDPIMFKTQQKQLQQNEKGGL